jgi:hypothetical protein
MIIYLEKEGEMKYKVFIIGLSFLLLLNFVSATISIELADQGSGVKTKSTGLLLTLGNLSVYIYDAATEGTLIYAENFTNAISNGSWNVILGENLSNKLNLEFNRKYFKNYKINDEDVNFTFNNGTVTDRKGFYSSIGELGRETNSSGTASLALGYQTKAISDYSTAMGFGSTANALISTAMGWVTRASGVYSTALGVNTEASGNTATAIGYQTNASGDYSTAIGYQTNASSIYSTAIGKSTKASGNYSTAIGDRTDASGTQSTAMGLITNASGSASTATGAFTKAIGWGSTAMGSWATANSDYSFAWGNGNCGSEKCINNNTGVFAVFGGLCVENSTNSCSNLSDGSLSAKEICINGNCRTVWPSSANGTNYSFDGSSASGINAVALGTNTNASGNYSTAMGKDTKATGTYSTAIGYNTSAVGYRSTAMGESTNASGWGSIATGIGTTASGVNSIAMGYSATANATNSFVWGDEWCVGQGENSGCKNSQKDVFALFGGLCVSKLGSLCPATPEGDAYIIGNLSAMGICINNTCKTSWSDISSSDSSATGSNAVAFGTDNNASGDNSIAMGYKTTASGFNSIAMGISSTANASSSFVWGGPSCNVGVGESSPCKISQQGVFGIFGGLCVNMVGSTCPNIYSGDIYVDRALTLKPTDTPNLPTEGMIYYNSTLHKPCYYNGSVWKQFNESICG